MRCLAPSREGRTSEAWPRGGRRERRPCLACASPIAQYGLATRRKGGHSTAAVVPLVYLADDSPCGRRPSPNAQRYGMATRRKGGTPPQPWYP